MIDATLSVSMNSTAEGGSIRQESMVICGRVIRKGQALHIHGPRVYWIRLKSSQAVPWDERAGA